MFVGVVFARFIGVTAGVRRVPVRHVRMVASFFVTACLMVLCGFAVVASGMFMMIGRFGMMFGALVLHGFLHRIRKFGSHAPNGEPAHLVPVPRQARWLIALPFNARLQQPGWLRLFFWDSEGAHRYRERVSLQGGRIAFAKSGGIKDRGRDHFAHTLGVRVGI